SLLIFLLLPFAWLRLQWRGRKEPGYTQHIGERFGRYRFKASRPVIWVHAVSVGETRAAAPLITALQTKYPNHQLLVTHMTPTGRATGESLFGDRVLRSFLPYDAPFLVRRFLDHFKPELGLIMETEIWPNLIAHCHEKTIPLWLVNARMSQKSANKYARFAKLTAESLAKFAGICAQTTSDAKRLTELGAPHIEICGNVKFDVTPPDSMLKLGSDLRERFGAARPTLLIASTREGEEELLLDALSKISIDKLLVILVPRHPQRFDEVAALVQKRGLKLQRRSANEPIDAATHVVLGDSMGEMFAYYNACDIAFIGGSLVPWGGQNLIEACAVGKAVLIGPHTFNFAEASEQAVACGAARRVANADALAQEVTMLLRDENARRAMSAAGIAFSQAHRGAVERILKIVTKERNL
ncbi:MAG TPA: lipid IV(A) 3-deoxy-D-manno-octulosonic acid transferase, partial [Burkholderiales bacterium]|nr:lipid IV(A) 3-deoxy-D-manno-octulosonic acid transferase [Burkholderiales bacterium]